MNHKLKVAGLLAAVAMLLVGVFPAYAAAPQIIEPEPSPGESEVPVNVSIATGVTQAVNPETVNETNVYLCEASYGIGQCFDNKVAAYVNTSGGGDTVVLTPLNYLEKQTTYRFVVTSGVESEGGTPFEAFEMTFTTANSSPPPPPAELSDVAFVVQEQVSEMFTGFATLKIGPDGRLYANTLYSAIYVWDINETTGELSNRRNIAPDFFFNQAMIGMAFDPASTPDNPIIWVTHNTNADQIYGGGRHFTSGISLLTVTDHGTPDEEWTVTEVIEGLPRSRKDHLANSLEWGPDGGLYLTQGSNSAMGDYDTAWKAPETLLSGAVLRIDTEALLDMGDDLPLNVATGISLDGGETLVENYGYGDPELDLLYNPLAPDAPVTVFGSGVRNAYDLVWHSNGRLYTPTNGSASGGNAPAEPAELPEACNYRPDGPYTAQNVPAATSISKQNDYLFLVEEGGYYGHPNPTRCEWVLNGGNPTAGEDPAEVDSAVNGGTPYPVGVQPDPNWQGFAHNFETSMSPNGAIEYRSNTFDGALQGWLLVTRYSRNDDVIALKPGGSGDDYHIVSVAESLPGLNSSLFDGPLDIIEDTRNGNLYIATLQEVAVNTFEGQIFLLTPSEAGTAAISTSADSLTFDAINGSSATAQTVTIENTGVENLTISSITKGGPNGGNFSLNTGSTDLTLSPGETTTFSVNFQAPNGVEGVREAVVTIASNDPDNPSVTVDLFGLSRDGNGGGQEPSLQYVLDAFGLTVDTGDDNDNSSEIHSESDKAQSPLITGSDEVEVPVFVKAANGPVEVIPLAAFGNNHTDDLMEVGWYEDGVLRSETGLFEVESGQYQTLNPDVDGVQFFNPGDRAFGFYSDWVNPEESTIYQDDAWTTYKDGKTRVRVYPYIDGQGATVPNWYIVAFEEYAFGFDFNDVVLLVKNVELADGGRMRLENQDWTRLLANPAVRGMEWVNEWLTFSGIADKIEAPRNHNQVDLEITNTHPTDDLVIDGVTFNNENNLDGVSDYSLNSPPSFPVNLTPGQSITLTVEYDRGLGDAGAGGELGAYVDTMTIHSNDVSRPDKTVYLGANWMLTPQAENETFLSHIAASFGYTSDVPDDLPNASWEAAGDEHLFKYWEPLDMNEDVYMIQLAAYHGSEQSATTSVRSRASFGTELAGMSHDENHVQEFFPDEQNTSLEYTERSFFPNYNGNNKFQVRIGGAGSCDRDNYLPYDPDTPNICYPGFGSKSGYTEHGTRWFPVIDPWGNYVVGVYFVGQDYAGSQNANHDYQDNVVLVANVTPAFPLPDTTVALEHIPEEVNAGETALIKVTVSNSGAMATGDVTMDLSWLSGSAQIDKVYTPEGTCSGTSSLSCNFGEMDAGQDIVVMVWVTVGSDLTIEAEVATSGGNFGETDDGEQFFDDPNVATEFISASGSASPVLVVAKETDSGSAQQFDFTWGFDGTDTPFTLQDQNGGTSAPTNDGAALQYNFENCADPDAPAPWVEDCGVAYGLNGSETYGWKKISDEQPFAAGAQARRRGGAPVPHIKQTFIQMQENDPDNDRFPVFWEHDLPQGLYRVTVSVGDPSFTDSIHSINLEGQPVIDGFIPTVGNELLEVTVDLFVTDGALTVDPEGGENTKINYISIQPLSIPANWEVFYDISPGQHVITEAIPDNWSLNGDITCEAFTGEPTFDLLPTRDSAAVTLSFGEAALCTFTNTFVFDNNRPTAEAGPDLFIADVENNDEETFTLDGTASTDSDGTIAEYIWSVDDTVLATGAQPEVTMTPGAYTVTLTVVDDDGELDSDTLEVYVQPNQVPVADAGPDQTVTATGGTADVTLDGSGSTDIDTPIASYRWAIQGSERATGVNPTIPLDVGTHVVTLIVTDIGGLSDSDTVTIIVQGEANTAPTANAGSNQTVTDTNDNGEEVVTLDGSGSTDSDGTIEDYYWELNGEQIASTAQPQVTLPVGTHEIQLTVTDNGGLKDTDTVVVTVNQLDNAAPVANAGPNQMLTDSDDSGNEEVTLDGSGSTDSDGGIVSYSWELDGSQIAVGETPTVTLSVGFHVITLTVTDNDGAMDTATVIVMIDGQGNAAPVANAGPNRTLIDTDGNGEETILLDGTASTDSDGVIASFAWSVDGSSIGTGAILPHTLGLGTHTIILTVTDDGGATDTDAIVVEVVSEGDPDNAAPIANAGPDQVIFDEGLDNIESVTLDGSASADNDGFIVSYSWAGPQSLTGEMPSVDLAPGEYSFILTVTDNDGAIDTDTVNIKVTQNPDEINDAPEFTNFRDRAYEEGSLVNFTLTAVDDDGDTLTFGAIGLPDWLTIDPATGTVTGTVPEGAAADSPYTIEATVSDGQATTMRSFQLTVTVAGGLTNLLGDGSFEGMLSGVDDWQLIGSGSPHGAVPYPNAIDGDYVIMFDGGNHRIEGVQQFIEVGGSAGDSFTLTLHLAGRNTGTKGEIGAQVFLRAEDGTVVGSCTTVHRPRQNTFAPQTLSCIAEADDAFSSIQVRVGGFKVQSGIYGFDAIRLVEN